jgi:cell division septal protein FtsQ
LWFRDSSFAAVHRVEVSDVSGPDAGAIVAALQHAARGTSTLDVDMAALRGAVSRFPQVRSLRVRAVFPHQLRIEVIEQLPVAVLDGPGGMRAAAAADGAVLGSRLVASDLPTITVPKLAAKVVHDATTLEGLRVLGAAPPSLVSFVANVSDGSKGITVALRDGMLVYFGNASRAHAKWLAFARVLVAEGSATATYIDVRLPERPAVGGSTAVLDDAELTELGGATASATAEAASAGTSASLIEALEAALGTAGASTTPATAGPSAVTSTEAGPSQTVAVEASAPAAEPNTTNAATAPATTGAAEAQVPDSTQAGG